MRGAAVDTALHLKDLEGVPGGEPLPPLSVTDLIRDAARDCRMVIDHLFGDGVMHRP